MQTLWLTRLGVQASCVLMQIIHQQQRPRHGRVWGQGPGPWEADAQNQGWHMSTSYGPPSPEGLQKKQGGSTLRERLALPSTYRDYDLGANHIPYLASGLPCTGGSSLKACLLLVPQMFCFELWEHF